MCVEVTEGVWGVCGGEETDDRSPVTLSMQGARGGGLGHSCRRKRFWAFFGVVAAFGILYVAVDEDVEIIEICMLEPDWGAKHVVFLALARVLLAFRLRGY